MIAIGMYKEGYNDKTLPSIFDLIQSNPIEEKNKILAYLKSKQPDAYAPNIFVDIIKKKSVGGPFCCYHDDFFTWRTDTIYYFERYNMKLDNRFIEYVLSQK
ncbi:MAG: hypothetical protein IJN71_07415 [Oscillospiraceae bacterium]|nr:hypothetical protein [Oscillospiraceae bacterium]